MAKSQTLSLGAEPRETKTDWGEGGNGNGEGWRKSRRKSHILGTQGGAHSLRAPSVLR